MYFICVIYLVRQWNTLLLNITHHLHSHAMPFIDPSKTITMAFKKQRPLALQKARPRNYKPETKKKSRSNRVTRLL